MPEPKIPCQCEIYESCSQCDPEGYAQEIARRQAASQVPQTQEEVRAAIAKELNDRLRALVEAGALMGYKLVYREPGDFGGSVHFHPGWFDGMAQGSASLRFDRLKDGDCKYKARNHEQS